MKQTWQCSDCNRVLLSKAGYVKHITVHSKPNAGVAEEKQGYDAGDGEDSDNGFFSESPPSSIGLDMSEISSSDEEDVLVPAPVLPHDDSPNCLK